MARDSIGLQDSFWTGWIVDDTTISDLKQQFEEDLSIIQRHIVVDRLLPLPDVRVILSPILRKWLLENNLALMCKALGYMAALPAVDTSVHEQIIAAGGTEFEFYCAGGTLIDGAPLNSIYVSTRPKPPGTTSLLPIPNLREYRIGHFLDRKCIYCDGQWITTRDVIKYIANKAGGIHFNNGRRDAKQHALEKARTVLHLGKTPAPGTPLSAPNYLEINGTSPQPWDCLYVEVLSIGQALLNIRLNGIPLIRYEDGEDPLRWLKQEQAVNVFDRFNARYHEG